MAHFPSSAERLESQVLEACGAEDEWPVRVAAAIYAAVDFATANPEAARSVAGGLRGGVSAEAYRRLVETISRELSREVPRGRRLAGAGQRALFDAIATVGGEHLRGGSAERLPEIGPELVHLALLPYLGFEAAKHWAKATERPG